MREQSSHLILIHGAGGSGRSFEALAPLLAREFSVEAPDLPGHGRSRLPGNGTIAGDIAHLAPLVEAHGDVPVVLVGHSRGSLLALSLALSHPAHVAAVVVLAGAAHIPVTPLLHRMIAEQFDQLPAFLQRAGFSRATPREVVEAWSHRCIDAPQPMVQADFRSLDDVDLSSRLSQILQPVLVVAGQDDRMVSPASSQALARSLPKGRHVGLPGTGHMLHQEQPTMVAQLIRELLDAVT